MKGTTSTIGLVDDHVLLRTALAGLIATLPGCRVVLEASNGTELLEQLTQKEIPDIIVLDINMPEMDGFETCRILTERYPSVKVLACSMLSEEAVIIRMIRAGARGYLLKSAEAAEIKTAFETLRSNQYYLPGQISKIIAMGLQSEQHQASEEVELNERETEFLKLICLELSHKEIGIRMHISKRTVDYYRDALFKKLNTKTRVGLVKYAIKKNLI